MHMSQVNGFTKYLQPLDSKENNSSLEWKNAVFPQFVKKEREVNISQNPESLGEAKAVKLIQELFSTAAQTTA